MEEKNIYDFKEGEWIVRVSDKVQVKEVKDDSIVLSDNTIIDSKSMNNYRKWRVYDAKKGDILYTKGGIGYERNGIIFICNGIENRDYIDEPCLGHCGFYSKDLNKFVPNTHNAFMGTLSDNIKDGTRPATPKERELLFEKMKQAGYKYNTEDNTTYTVVRHQFIKGDFIVNKITDEVFQIDKLVEDINTNEIIYMLADGKGYITEETEDNYRIWTLQDADDGEILYSPSHKLVWIYKEEYQKTYAFANLNYPNYNVGINGYFITPSDARPATKHECELLHQNLEKAGYKWKPDSKEIISPVTTSKVEVSASEVGFPELDELWNSEVNNPISNLEDATEEYVGDELIGIHGEDAAYLNEILGKAFKAGAEWLANQGETHEATVVENYDGALLGEEIYLDKFKKGDTVIVQIRKA